jgi:hypothetical protein
VSVLLKNLVTAAWNVFCGRIGFFTELPTAGRHMPVPPPPPPEPTDPPLPVAPPEPEVVAPPAAPLDPVEPPAAAVEPVPAVALAPLEPVAAVEPVVVDAAPPAPLEELVAPEDPELVALAVPLVEFELGPADSVPQLQSADPKIKATTDTFGQELTRTMEASRPRCRATLGGSWSRCQVALPKSAATGS